MTKPIRMQSFLALSFSLFVSVSNAVPPGLSSLDQVIPNIEAIYEKEGVGPDYSANGFAALEKLYDRLIEKYEEDESKGDKKAKKTAGDVLPFYRHGRSVLKNNAARNEEERAGAFLLAKSILASTLTIDLDDTAERYPEAFRAPPFFTGDFENMLLKVLLGQIPAEQTPPEIKALLQQIPPELNQALPAIKNLLQNDPATGNKLLLRAKRVFFAKKNVEIKLPTKPEELAELGSPAAEIGDGHPVWYSRKALNAIGPTAKARWQHLEKLVADRVSREIGEKYDLQAARRVLFFDEAKTNATSPKIDTKDAYDQEWKIKWGDEIQPEVISNRLYVAMGGKINDLTYASKAGELILILKKKKKDGECSPVTSAELTECLLKSGYNYNLAPNILAVPRGESETIDKKFFDRELAKLRPKNLTAKEWEEKCIGRNYVKFREALVEFGLKKIAEKGGAPGYSSELAKGDAIARSLVLFNMWIGNRDAKDDNNKAYLLNLAPRAKTPGLLALDGNVYLESQHDLGHSMGQIFAAGEVASMKGRDFILNNITSQEKCLSREAVLCFKEPMLFVPEAWRQATAKDLVFMARIIVGFMKPYLEGHENWLKNENNDDDLKWIVSQTNWPRFMQLAVIGKLAERTLGIIDALKMYAPDLAEGDPRSFEFDYAPDEANLKQLAGETGLAEGTLKAESDGKDLVTKGQLSRCESPADNRLIDFLQRQRFPSGLVKRISRLNDGQAAVGCDSVRGGIRELISGLRPQGR